MTMISEQGSDVFFYSTFVTQAGVAASVSGSPVLSVYHRDSVGTSTDISGQIMTLLNGTTYFYKWQPTMRAFKGNYVAKYAATYTDANNVVGEEPFQIVLRGHYKRKGGGLVARSSNVVVEGQWDEIEKKRVFDLLDSLTNKVEMLGELKGLVSMKVGQLTELDAKLLSGIEKQQGSMYKINVLIEELRNKEPQVHKIDDINLRHKIDELQNNLVEFRDINENLRIPTILTELEEVRTGLENLQVDLAKLLIGDGIRSVTTNEKIE